LKIIFEIIFRSICN